MGLCTPLIFLSFFSSVFTVAQHAMCTMLQSLLATSWFVRELWSHLEGPDRVALFFVSSDVRAAVVENASRFVVNRLHDQTLHRTWRLMELLPDSVSVRLCVPLYQRYPTTCQKYTWAEVPAALPGLAPSMQVKELDLGHPITSEVLADFARACPGVQTIDIRHSDNLFPMPPVGLFPDLRTLRVHLQVIPINPIAPAVYHSLAPYVPQLTEFFLPRDIRFWQDAVPIVFAPQSPPALNLHSLGVHTDLSDRLLQLIHRHCPQLVHLDVYDLPLRPLREPCSVRSVTFTECESIQQLAYVPTSVTKLYWEVPHYGITLSIGTLSPEEEARAYEVCALLVMSETESSYDVMLKPNGEENDVADFQRQARVVRRVSELWEMEMWSVQISGFEMSAAMMEPLRSLPPCHTVMLYPQWLEGDDLYSGLLPTVREIALSSVHIGVGSSNHKLTNFQLASLLESAPRDRTRQNPLKIMLSGYGMDEDKGKKVVDLVKLIQATEVHPHVTFACDWVDRVRPPRLFGW